MYMYTVRGHFPDLSINQFVSRLTFQLQRVFSRRPDPLAEATDTFLQDWRREKAFANPSWNLVGWVLMKVEEQVVNPALVVPMWYSQSWHPNLLSLLVLAPLRIPPGKEAMVQVGDVPLLELASPLAVWHISGSTRRTREFLEKLPSSSCRLGIGSPPNCMIPAARGESAGVMSSVLTLFQDQQRMW